MRNASTASGHRPAEPAVAGAPGTALDENRRLAARLGEYSDLLEQQAASPFRVQAFRKAAVVLGALPRPVSEILASEGRAGLDALPGVGPGIAAALAELSATGRWSQLDRALGDARPDALFRTLPGVGPVLARRLAQELQLSSLEALEVAAHDGRLAGAPGWGRRRVQMVQTALAERLGRPRLRRARDFARRPPAAMLLDVDREYREAAAAGRLRTIAPRRFNPGREAWLPILHTERGDWRFTALFSNTALAHRLGRTGDWVLIYYDAGHAPEGQCTVVTETRGAQAGERVVRGRGEDGQGAVASQARIDAAQRRSPPG